MEVYLTCSGTQTMAGVDPHIARIAGLAYDDTSAAMLPQLLAYKVVGRWRGTEKSAWVGDPGLAELAPEVVQERPVRPGAPDRLRLPAGPGLPAPGRPSRHSFDSDLGADGVLAVRLGLTVERLGLELTAAQQVTVVALDSAGAELDSATVVPSRRGDSAELRGDGIERVEIRGSGRVTVTAFRWRVAVVQRYGLIPGIPATDPGPPPGPSRLAVTQAGDSREIEVEIDVDPWPAVIAPEVGSIGVQVAGTRTGPLGPAPAVPPFDRSFLLREGGVALPGANGSVVMRDVGLAEGWWAWWARGVDLFGRCSLPTPPATVDVTDAIAPPPPMIVLAEQVQADLPDSAVAVLGRSPLATSWLTANPGVDALACCLSWTPELAALAPDVDAFRLYVRRPLAQVPADPRDPAFAWEGVPWGTPVTTLGPVPTRVAATATGAATTLSIDVTAVAEAPALPAADPGAPAEPRRFVLTTDLDLDTGSGELIGALLGTWTVIGNGDGPHATVDVTVPAGAAAPVVGTYLLGRGMSTLLTIDTGVTRPATGDPFRQAYAGLLEINDDRYRVLGLQGGTLVCAADGAPAPATGATGWWYPAWALTIRDTGFGPIPDAATPVARAQVVATAVRRSGTSRALESSPSAPATVLAVDTRVPATPTVPEIQVDPGERCARLATRADWYGISRFTLTVTPDAGSQYLIERALDDALWQRDRDRRAQPGYAVDLSPAWMAPLLAGVRGQQVTADLAALTTDLAAAATELEVERAYGKLHVDAARILAAQDWVADAYVQRTTGPLPGTALPYTDELEGRSRAHWFYRVQALSGSGVQSGWSPPTPPICCPDVVPPPAPVARLALAADRAVTVSWLPVPAFDLDGYLVYRGRDDAEVADVRDLTPVATVTDTTVTVPCDPGAWRFRIVAVDREGNRSRPSNILAGSALLPPPDPPAWVSATRAGDTVVLVWTATEPRLSTLVERRPVAGGFWSAVSGWLPRAVYTYTDAPPDPAAAWAYRLKVRDALGQQAAAEPTTSVPER